MSSGPHVVGDYYATLGLSREATAEEIKKAFRKLARECHPDVAKEDAGAAERFNKVRAAYEVLIDPVRRAQYDRRSERRSRVTPDGVRMPGGFTFRTGSGGGGPSRGRAHAKANNLDLEDIFADYGAVGDFGFGSSGPAERTERPKRPGRAPPPVERAPGRDISLVVDVPESVAAKGGVVTLSYPRLRRASDGQTLHRYDEIYDLRLEPETAHGSTLRIPRMGDAGNDGSADGDLVCDLRVVPDPSSTRPGRSGTADDAPRGVRGRKEEDAPTEEAPPRPRPRPEPPRGSTETRFVPITVAEAILGGRIEVATPAGRVRLTIPPGTSSGTRLRLRGKGDAGADLFVEFRIVVPKEVDDESRALIERFAALNPREKKVSDLDT